jgi:uncharacterized protein (TIGR00369 family)
MSASKSLDERKRSPFSAHIGTTLEELGEGRALLSVRLDSRHTNLTGVMHGGAVTTMMDSALGAALSDMRGEEVALRPHATIEMDACFLAAARPGDEIVVEGRVIRLGSRVAFGEAEARRRGDDELIAKGSFVFAITNRGR